MEPKPSKGRIRELDFVRGVAILMVMGAHSSGAEQPAIPGYQWFFSTFGPHGVDLFFVLSGFLVGGLLIQEIAKERLRVSTFIIRRAFKIWPMYYVYIGFIVLMHRHPLNTFLAANLLHIQNYMGTSLGHTWSLAVEEHFYLLLPAFLMLIWNRETPVKRVIHATAVVAVLVLFIRCVTTFVFHDLNVGYYTHTRIDALLFGVMISAIYHLDHEMFQRLANKTYLLIAMVVLAAAVRAFASIELLNTLGITLIYLGAGAGLLLVYAHSGRFSSRSWYKAIAWIGLYSYGIFLWHNSVRDVVMRLFGSWTGPTGWVVRELARFAAGIAIGVVISRLVEWPFIRIRDAMFPRTERAVASPESQPQTALP